jgi:pimeloyl-ACP methyl ester carboxylesterase
MQTVISSDGTKIAYELSGSGPLLIIITGALNTRNFGTPSDLVPLLHNDFTVLTYDRRGRGDSGIKTPYTVRKEIDDLQALIHANGGKAFLYGHSAGAALALFASFRLPEQVKAIAAYEPPVSTGWLHDLKNKLRIEEIKRQVKKGDHRAVTTSFMRFVGMGESKIADVLSGEKGPVLIDMAATIAHEALIQTENRYFLRKDARKLTQPVLMLAGDKSFRTSPGIMQAFAEVIPNAQAQLMQGQTHSVDAEVLAPILREFFLKLSCD